MMDKRTDGRTGVNLFAIKKKENIKRRVWINQT